MARGTSMAMWITLMTIAMAIMGLCPIPATTLPNVALNFTVRLCTIRTGMRFVRTDRDFVTTGIAAIPWHAFQVRLPLWSLNLFAAVFEPSSPDSNDYTGLDIESAGDSSPRARW